MHLELCLAKICTFKNHADRTERNEWINTDSLIGGKLEESKRRNERLEEEEDEDKGEGEKQNQILTN